MDTKKPTRLGQILLEKGLITREQLNIAVSLQTQRRKDTNLNQQLATSLGEILIEQGFIDRLQLNRGLNWQLLLRKMTLVMSFCAPIMAVFSPAALAAPVKRIEAESYSAMSGVQAEPSTDVGGGQNVGYIHDNDWMTYKNVTINAPVAGQYKITYRVAGPGGGSFALKNADTNAIYDTVNVANTGGWTTWKNVERIITLPAGNHSFTISIIARGNGFNLNWFDVESVGNPLPFTIQAEDYSTMSGIQAETTSDVGGGKNIGYIDSNDWMAYANHPVYIPTTGSYKITYRVAGPGGGSFALKESDGSVIHDTVNIGNTGGWATWTNVERTVTLTQGTHSFLLSIIARGNGFNINWFKIESISNNSSSSSLSSANSSMSSSSKSSSSVASSVASSASSSSSSSAANSSAPAEKVSAVAGAVGLTWLIPSQRENGQFLYVT